MRDEVNIDTEATTEKIDLEGNPLHVFEFVTDSTNVIIQASSI